MTTSSSSHPYPVLRKTETALSEQSPVIAQLAKYHRMRPVTMLQRIQAAFPARIEQDFYLALVVDGAGARRPGTIRAVLDAVLNGQHLQEGDLVDIPQESNLVSNKMVDTIESTRLALDLLAAMEEIDYPIGAKGAGIIVRQMGDLALELPGLIEEAIVLVREKRQYRNTPHRGIFGAIITVLIEEIQGGGRVFPQTSEDLAALLVTPDDDAFGDPENQEE